LIAISTESFRTSSAIRNGDGAGHALPPQITLSAKLISVDKSARANRGSRGREKE